MPDGAATRPGAGAWVRIMGRMGGLSRHKGARDAVDLEDDVDRVGLAARAALRRVARTHAPQSVGHVWRRGGGGARGSLRTVTRPSYTRFDRAEPKIETLRTSSQPWKTW